MLFIRFIIVGIISTLFLSFAPAAQALPGDTPSEPYYVTDARLVPHDAEMTTAGCETIYTWTVVTPDEFLYEVYNVEYYSYHDYRICETRITPRFIVVDRCGWRRDNVRVRHDDRYESIRIRQLTKTQFRIRLIAYEDHFIVKPNREISTRFATFYRHTSNRSC